MKPFWFSCGPGSASLWGRGGKKPLKGSCSVMMENLLRSHAAPCSPFPQWILPRALALGEMSMGEPKEGSWEPAGGGLSRRVLGTCTRGNGLVLKYGCNFNRLGAHSRATTGFWHPSGKKSVVAASFMLIKSCCARCVRGGGYEKLSFFGVSVTGRERGG